MRTISKKELYTQRYQNHLSQLISGILANPSYSEFDYRKIDGHRRWSALRDGQIIDIESLVLRAMVTVEWYAERHARCVINEENQDTYRKLSDDLDALYKATNGK
jgi:hypothetical protein